MRGQGEGSLSLSLPFFPFLLALPLTTLLSYETNRRLGTRQDSRFLFVSAVQRLTSRFGVCLIVKRENGSFVGESLHTHNAPYFWDLRLIILATFRKRIFACIEKLLKLFVLQPVFFVSSCYVQKERGETEKRT